MLGPQATVDDLTDLAQKIHCNMIHMVMVHKIEGPSLEEESEIGD